MALDSMSLESIPYLVFEEPELACFSVTHHGSDGEHFKLQLPTVVI